MTRVHKAQMIAHVRSRLVIVLLTCTSLAQPFALSAEPILVRHREGLVHGFLVLRTLDGKVLAQGDLSQISSGDRVTSHLVFHFKDGSKHEETAIFSQRRSFRLLKDHLVQSGPAFKHPMDVSIDGSTGQFTVHYKDDDGKDKEVNERLKLPSDVANGMILTLLKNIPSDTAETTVSLVAATPKPRIVKLAITAKGEDSFSTEGSSRKATHYVVKVEIGGVTGLLAPLLGKQPEDIHIWVLVSEAPVIVRMEGALYFGGPIWRIELTSPVWP